MSAPPNPQNDKSRRDDINEEKVTFKEERRLSETPDLNSTLTSPG